MRALLKVMLLAGIAAGAWFYLGGTPAGHYALDREALLESMTEAGAPEAIANVFVNNARFEIDLDKDERFEFEASVTGFNLDGEGTWRQEDGKVHFDFDNQSASSSSFAVADYSRGRLVFRSSEFQGAEATLVRE